MEGYNAEYALWRNTVSQLSAWRLSAKRTILASLAFGGVIAAVSLIGLHGGFGGTSGGGGPPPVQ